MRGSGSIRLPPCVQYNAGGNGCQGRRQGRRSSEQRVRLNTHMTQKALTEHQSSEHWSCIESGCRHIPLHMLDRFCKLLHVSYEEVLHGATDARIRKDAKPEQTRSYEERFGAIIADCPQDAAENILSICEQIAHLPGLRK